MHDLMLQTILLNESSKQKVVSASTNQLRIYSFPHTKAYFTKYGESAPSNRFCFLPWPFTTQIKGNYKQIHHLMLQTID